MLSGREDWLRLASYVVSARVAAGCKDRRSFAAATGITERTLGNLERGIRVAPETLAIVESTLGWRPGSARSILAGGEPILSEAVNRAEPRYTDPALQAIWEVEGLSAEVRRALIGLAVAMRQQNHTDSETA